MKSTTWKLRIEEEELALWKAHAADEAMTLSQWIRECCNAELTVKRGYEEGANQAVRESRGVGVSERRVDTAQRVAGIIPGFVSESHDKTCQCGICKFRKKVLG